MDIMDAFTSELLWGPPIPVALSGSGAEATNIDDYLRAIGSIPALRPVDYYAAMEEPVPSLLLESAVPVSDAAESNNSAMRSLLSDYDADIDFNLRMLEMKVEEPARPDYLKTVQGDRMSPSMRANLVIWMDGFARYYGLAPGVLPRAVSYVDRVLSERTLPMTHMEYELHLLGATAVFTAAKYEEQATIFKINAATIARDCGFASSKEVIAMECKMLAALRYELSTPTAYTFVDHFTRFSKGERDLEVQKLAHQLAETSLVEYRCLQLMPSAVAASAVFLARLILNPMTSQVQKWNREFTELTGYKPTDLILGIECLYMMNPDPRFVVLPAFLQDK
ncbi:putative cyclin-F2-1 [Hordeum vulgare subsp. vulgare]|uniref:Cyclin N-terminal domain-containing protein n=1 Tax=Hordeum vulgare subsp. vulgare TaxID=112509 RepID=A0A8I6Y2F1_HORVV|nr:putative cyclin-F2-1 [Hordeum vulgare subsp. vulgare]